MDRHVSEAWVGRVLAWHHKHPLARRLRRADVQGLGYVDLPYAAAEGAPRAHWNAAFSEDFLPPHPPARIADWARAQGTEQEPDDAWPRRLVAIDRQRLPPEGQALHLWVGTAAIETPAGMVRVLVSPTAPHAVLGRRLLSRPRMAAASLALLMLLALPLGAWRQHRLAQLAAAADDDEPPMVVLAPAAVASAAHPPAEALAPAASAAVGVAAAEPASTATATQAPADPHGDPQAETHAEAPARVQAAASSAPATATGVPKLNATLDDDARAQARRAVAEARRQRALQQVARGGAAWAVAGAHKRTPGESELLLPLLQAAAADAHGARCGHVEVLPAGDDFRAVCWPFARREDAERVRELLAARGQAVQVLEF